MKIHEMAQYLRDHRSASNPVPYNRMVGLLAGVAKEAPDDELGRTTRSLLQVMVELEAELDAQWSRPAGDAL